MGKDQEFLEAARNGNIAYMEKVLIQKVKRAGPLASLRRGTGVNCQDNGGYSALHHACLNGHIDIVKLLLAHEASTNLPDIRGSSPLHLAAWAGEEQIVKLLLAHPYRPANANFQTTEKETPLHCAAQHGHTEALKILLNHSADPNMRNNRGETPLDLACQYGRLQVVHMLIRSHPELIAPYSRRAVLGNQSINNKSRHSSPLPHSSSMSTSSPSSSSSPVTPTNYIYPHTCLHVASRNGHTQIVETLLAAGVNVNLLTPSGTALHEAALCGKELVVKTLLKAGIDLNATDAEERTVLDVLKEFPPHVTKHIIDVITNFRSQMDTDDGDEIIYRYQTTANPSVKRNHSSASYYQKQQNNKYYHLNSNNHLLNHSHSMQQSSYNNSSNNSNNRQRYSTGRTYNGGKSLDSGLEEPNNMLIRRTSPIRSHSNTSQHDMGDSPSSSMSSFEPASISPHSRCSTGGVSTFLGNTPTLTSFIQASAPKKPPRRNLSVSPTNTETTFSYTSPNHQLYNNRNMLQTQQMARSPSNDSPYSHQSQSSVGGFSMDDSKLKDFQRDGMDGNTGNHLFIGNRENGHSSTEISIITSSDILEKRHYDNCENDRDNDADDNEENLEPNIKQDVTTNSIKRPKPAPRNLDNISKDNANTNLNNSMSLKSYNPNRKLKRNRNTCSLTLSDSSDMYEQGIRTSLPQSPTHYKQPPTPDHPPPSSSQAEHTIHERIRPLSQEYKRRSALWQLHKQQQQQQQMTDISTSPLRQLIGQNSNNSNYDYAFINSPKKYQPNENLNIYSSLERIPVRGSSNSLSSNVSLSDQSASTDNVEEFIGDAPFDGLIKGSGMKYQQIEATYATINKKKIFQAYKKPVPAQRPQQQLQLLRQQASQQQQLQQQQRQSEQLQPEQQEREQEVERQQGQIPVYATIHKKRGTTTTTAMLGEQKLRPPVPAKPVVPEKIRQHRTQTSQLPLHNTSNENFKLQNIVKSLSNNVNPTLGQEPEPEPELQQQKRDKDKDEKINIIDGTNVKDDIDTTTTAAEVTATSNHSMPASNGTTNVKEISQQQKVKNCVESSNENNSSTAVASTQQENCILSPFNADEARKKISEIIESFGTGILNSNVSPTNEIDLDFDDIDIVMPINGQILVSHLHKAGLLHLKKLLFENGYDNYKFMCGIIENDDLRLMHISATDCIKLLNLIHSLPKAVFQNPNTYEKINGNTSLKQWLQSIDLLEYIELFNKHLYNSLESVCGVWDVELQTVLEINKIGHRKRILQSIATIKEMYDTNQIPRKDVAKMQVNKRLTDRNGNGKELRHSTSGYRKNRPAPQPPCQQKPMQQSIPKQSLLQIRAPSELLLDIPENLRTKWRHSPNVLLNEQIKYVVNYLGSTIVKELRGTESTRKSIEKLKQDHNDLVQSNLTPSTKTNMLMSTMPEINAAHQKSFQKHKEIVVTLAISHRGVEFLDISTKNTICEHEIENINCACQDTNDMRYFAYITKEINLHYCHVFRAETNEFATDIILTLGQAFEVAYQMALRDGITTTPLTSLKNTILQSLELNNKTTSEAQTTDTTELSTTTSTIEINAQEI